MARPERNTIVLGDALNAIMDLQKEYRAWQQSDGPTHMGRKAISKALFEAFEQATDALADQIGQPDENGNVTAKEVEESARQYVIHMDAVANAFRDWVRHSSMAVAAARPDGSDDLDKALDHLFGSLAPSKFRKPEPLEVLFAMNAPPHQTALKYGWIAEDGSPDVQKVYEEKEKPGTHYDPKTWVHPVQRKIQADVNAQWASRQPRPPYFVKVDELAAGKPKAKRSFEQFVAERAPLGQLANLFNISIEEAAARVDQLGGYPPEETEIRPANATVAVQEQIAKEEAAARKAEAATRKSKETAKA